MSDAWDNTDVRDATPEEEILINTILEQRKQIEELEAKLAKAMQALKDLADCAEDGRFWSEMQLATAIDTAYTAIAELKGEQP